MEPCWEISSIWNGKGPSILHQAWRDEDQVHFLRISSVLTGTSLGMTCWSWNSSLRLSMTLLKFIREFRLFSKRSCNLSLWGMFVGQPTWKTSCMRFKRTTTSHVDCRWQRFLTYSPMGMGIGWSSLAKLKGTTTQTIWRNLRWPTFPQWKEKLEVCAWHKTQMWCAWVAVLKPFQHSPESRPNASWWQTKIGGFWHSKNWQFLVSQCTRPAVDGFVTSSLRIYSKWNKILQG